METANNKRFEDKPIDTKDLTPKLWCAQTNAIGLISKRGNSGGTYAHLEIAFDFKMWLSPSFRFSVVEVIPKLKGDLEYPASAPRTFTNEDAKANRSRCYLQQRSKSLERLADGSIDKTTIDTLDERIADKYRVERTTGTPLDGGSASEWSRSEIDERLFFFESLTDAIRDDDEPSAAIVTWLRSRGTAMFLSLWEKKRNPAFDEDGCEKLLIDLKSTNTTLTPKLWCERTNAIGLLTLRGNGGGTFAHPEIEWDFRMWYSAEYRLTAVKMGMKL